MGQKVHPYGFRLGFNRTWHSNWIAKRDYADLLHEDLKLKKELKGRFAGAGVSHIDIERAANKLKIIIHTSRPGIIIGRKGAEIDKLKQEIKDRTGREVYVNIQEIHKPELNAQLQAEQIAQQLEKRIAFRRAMRRAVENAQRFGAQGIKVRVSGRLNGAEIARSEWYLQGRLPLHTLRADIDYGFAQAHTTFGVIGVKVWIYRGDIVPYKTPPDVAQAAALAAGDPTGGPKPRRVVSSSAAARRRSTSETVEVTAAPEELDETVAPLVKEADPEFERLLAEEEEIERSTRDHHETPHFRMDD